MLLALLFWVVASWQGHQRTRVAPQGRDMTALVSSTTYKATRVTTLVLVGVRCKQVAGGRRSRQNSVEKNREENPRILHKSFKTRASKCLNEEDKAVYKQKGRVLFVGGRLARQTSKEKNIEKQMGST